MINYYELTNPQKSIWLMEKYYTNTTINNICTSATIYGNVNIKLLKQAINNVIEQNDNFRIHIVEKDNDVKQYISDYKPFDIDIKYVSNEFEINQIEKEEVKYKFDIIDSNLFKFVLAVNKNNYTCIILTVNHIIADSWALGLVIKEILRNYNYLKNNKQITQETFSYIDYIDSEKKYNSSKKFEIDKSYWNEVFKTIPGQATIPSCKNNVKTSSYNAKRMSFKIQKDVVSEINNFCQKYNISTFNFFMTIFSIYIYAVSNVDDFVIGTPILNRTNFKDKHTIGMFINTMPIRVNNLNQQSFKDLAINISKTTLASLRHQKYSYNLILDDLRAKEENVPNLYNILISYQVTKAFDESLGNYKTNWVFNNYCANDFNIHIYDINDTGCLIINYDFLVDKYSDEYVSDIHNHIMNMINQVLNNNEINSNDIEIITTKEKDKILNKFNNTYIDYPKNKTIVDLFEEQVQKTPNNIAIVSNGKNLTYKELNNYSNQLANFLVSSGIKNGDIIGIMLNRSIEMIIRINCNSKNR